MKSFLTLAALLVLFACAEEKVMPVVENSDIKGEIPSHESWNSRINFSDDGRLTAVLYTDHLKKFELEKSTYLEGVRINFLDKEQKVVSTLTSRRGKVDDVTRDMYAIDSVVAVNDSGTVLKTSELKWRNSDQKIVTDKFVSIKSTKEIIEGFGLESDQNLRNYVIFNPTYSATVSKEKEK